jgi:PAS domain-containing protein
VRSSEKLLRTLVDHSVNGILRLRWVTEDDSTRGLRCIFANAAASNFMNMPASEIIDSSGADVMLRVSTGLDPAESERLRKDFEDAVQNGVGVDTESLVKGADRNYWLRIIAEPVGDDIAITLVDITDRKAKELQMESIA